MSRKHNTYYKLKRFCQENELTMGEGMSDYSYNLDLCMKRTNTKVRGGYHPTQLEVWYNRGKDSQQYLYRDYRYSTDSQEWSELSELVSLEELKEVILKRNHLYGIRGKVFTKDEYEKLDTINDRIPKEEIDEIELEMKEVK